MTNRYLQVDPMLTNISIGYQNGQMVGTVLFPILQVGKQSGKHFVYDKGRFRSVDTKRGANSSSRGVTLNISASSAFFCDDHALHQWVPQEDVDNAISPVDPMIDATENLTDMLMIRHETECVDIATSTSLMTQNVTLSGTDQWSDYTNSDPFSDVKTAKQTIQAAIGQKPNVMVIGQEVFDWLADHPLLTERVKYSQLGVLTVELLARLFEVDRVVVASAYKVSSDEGQTETTAYIFGKNVVLAYVAPRIAQKIVTLGLTYVFKNRVAEKVWNQDKRATMVRVGDFYYDVQLVSASAGYLIKNAVA